MSESEPVENVAWLPLTPYGVAAFAQTSFSRLATVLAAVAVLFAAVTVWFLCACWVPVMSEAVHRLPEKAAISRGVLDWQGDTPVRLGENKWLAVVVDARDAESAGRVADLEVLLGGRRLVCGSLFGYSRLQYSRDWNVSLNRGDWLPWWGAWRWPILAVVAVGTSVGLLIGWFLLAVIYAPFLRVVCARADRAVSWRGAWQMSAAALMPGTFLLMLGLAGYGFGFLDLIHLVACYGLHLITGWFFLVLSPFFLPKRPTAGKGRNPFAGQAVVPQEQPETKNPFTAPD